MPTNKLNKTPYLEAIASDIRTSITRNGYNTTGQALGSIRVRNNRNVIARGYVSTLFQDVGRAPGRRPPANMIEQWVINKNLRFTRDSGAPMTTSQMAFIIARKIGAQGTRIFRDRRRGIRMKEIIAKNNRIYMPQIARDLKNTYVEAFNLSIIS